MAPVVSGTTLSVWFNETEVLEDDTVDGRDVPLTTEVVVRVELVIVLEDVLVPVLSCTTS